MFKHACMSKRILATRIVLLNNHLFGKEPLIRFTVRVCRESLSLCVRASYPFGFEGEIWNLIELFPGHCFIFFTLPLTYAIACLLFRVHAGVIAI